jgi:hypothetical protein
MGPRAPGASRPARTPPHPGQALTISQRSQRACATIATMPSTAADSPAISRRPRSATVSLAAFAAAVAVIPVWVHLSYATVRWDNHAWGWFLLDVGLALAPLAPLVAWRPLAKRHASRSAFIAAASVGMSVLASLVSFGLAVIWL